MSVRLARRDDADLLERNYRTFVIGSIFSIFLLWVLSDLLDIGNVYLKLLVFLLPYFACHILLKRRSFRKTHRMPHIILNCLIIITVLVWLLPVFSAPDLPMGKGFTKPYHDAMSAHIARHGTHIEDMENTMFAYPDVMHSLGGFFSQLGFPVMHANLAATIFVMILNAYVLFLLLNRFYGDKCISAVFAGIFSLSTFHIPYLYYLSPPQSFVLFLVLPAFFFFCASWDERKYLPAFGVTVGLIAASYSNLWLIVAGLLFGGAALFLFFDRLVLGRKRVLSKDVKHLAFLLIVTAVFCGIALGAQEGIYWDNMVGERNDCADSAHYMFPLVPFAFLCLFAISAGLFLWKKKFNTLLGFLALLFIIVLLTPVAYEIIFDRLHPMTEEACWDIDNDGLFGGWTHLRVHRVAFMQAFFFYLLLPMIPLAFKDWWRWIATAGVMLFLLLFMFNPLYGSGPSDGEVKTSHLTPNDMGELTAPSFMIQSLDWVEKGWSPELRRTLDDLHPLLSEDRKLVLVSYGKKSLSYQWFVYIYLDRHYKYVLKPRLFFEKYVQDYHYIISQPCITDKIPSSYTVIKEENDFCLLEKTS